MLDLRKWCRTNVHPCVAYSTAASNFESPLSSCPPTLDHMLARHIGLCGRDVDIDVAYNMSSVDVCDSRSQARLTQHVNQFDC